MGQIITPQQFQRPPMTRNLTADIDQLRYIVLGLLDILSERGLLTQADLDRRGLPIRFVPRNPTAAGPPAPAPAGQTADVAAPPAPPDPPKGA